LLVQPSPALVLARAARFGTVPGYSHPRLSALGHLSSFIFASREPDHLSPGMLAGDIMNTILFQLPLLYDGFLAASKARATLPFHCPQGVSAQ